MSGECLACGAFVRLAGLLAPSFPFAAFLFFRSRQEREQRRRLAAFRGEVEQACRTRVRADLERLLQRPADLGLSEDDVAVEVERVDGALSALELMEGVGAGAPLPEIVTHHRILGDDRCHLAVPAVLVDQGGAGQSGKLFLTHERFVFLGSPVRTVGWGSVSAVEELHRDVILTHPARQARYQFRCNTYADAMRAAYLARLLMERTGRRRQA